MTQTDEKEVGMRKNPVLKFVCLFLFVFLVIPFSNARARTAEEIIGHEAPYFTLPSTEDRAISYLDEYYGKFHLVMTFSPAAFTPT
jgi:hypothetical protein